MFVVTVTLAHRSELGEEIPSQQVGGEGNWIRGGTKRLDTGVVTRKCVEGVASDWIGSQSNQCSINEELPCDTGKCLGRRVDSDASRPRSL